MIVDCESCHTRFRLEDTRIPATGARVRCSRCKTSFVVYRPNVSADEIVQEVVAEASQSGQQRAPETTADLFESSGQVIGEGAPAPRPEGKAGSSDEQWEFEEEPGTARSTTARVAEGAKASRAKTQTAPAEPRDEEVLPSLGAPSDWDFLGESAERIAKDVSFQPSRPSKTPKRARAGSRAETPADDPVESSVRASAAALQGGRASRWRETLGGALDFVVIGSGWIAAAALCLIGLWLALQPRSPLSGAPSARLVGASLGDAALEVSVHGLESAVAGSFVVVRGQLPAAAPSEPQRIRVTWLDAKGAPLGGASAVAGPPLSKRKLREQALERLQAEHAAHAPEVAAGGRFEALFAELPAGAASIALSRERVPVPATSPAVLPGEATGVTASSPPSAPPSSE